MRALRNATTVGAFAWALMLPLATFAASRAHLEMVVSAFALAVYAIGAVVCHQLPARSFHLWGAQMPVCARCTGIYVGAAMCAVGAMLAGREAGRRDPDVAPGRDAARGFGRAMAFPRTAAALAMAPSAATLAYEWATGIMPSNALRFAAGLWLGGVLAAMVVAATSAAGPEVN